MKKFLSLMILSLLASLAPLAADDIRLYVVHAQGRGFEYIRDGKPADIDLSTHPAVGFEFKAGDLVNVDAHTTLELQLYPSQTFVKISESSSFTVKAVNGAGTLDIDMAYGRLRTKTAGRLPQGVFRYNGVDVTAKNANSDFGFDQIFTGSRELVPAFYCFGGALQITKAASALSGAAASVNVTPQEMVTVVRTGANRVELVKTGLGAEMKTLWQKNDFKTLTADSILPPDTATLARTEPEEVKITPPPPVKTVTPAPVTVPAPTPTPSPVPARVESSRNTPELVDNKENALGTREKLSAVDEKNIFINPDFSREKEKAAAAAPEPEEEKKVAAEKAAEPAAESAPEPETTPAPAPAPQPDPNAPPVVSVAMDIGLDIHYMPMFDSSMLLPTVPGMEFAIDLLNFLMHMRAGVIADLDLMFFGIIGFGVEAGFYYNEVTVATPPFNLTLIHIFTIPVVGTIRLTLGPLFLQPHFGVVFSGGAIADVVFWGPMGYTMGGKLGLRLGNLTIYGTVNLMSGTIDGLFTPSAYFTFGGGLLLKIF